MRLGDSDSHKVPRKGLNAKISVIADAPGLGCNADWGSLPQHPFVVLVPGQHPVPGAGRCGFAI